MDTIWNKKNKAICEKLESIGIPYERVHSFCSWIPCSKATAFKHPIYSKLIWFETDGDCEVEIGVCNREGNHYPYSKDEIHCSSLNEAVAIIARIYYEEIDV